MRSRPCWPDRWTWTRSSPSWHRTTGWWCQGAGWPTRPRWSSRSSSRRRATCTRWGCRTRTCCTGRSPWSTPARPRSCSRPTRGPTLDGTVDLARRVTAAGARVYGIGGGDSLAAACTRALPGPRLPEWLAPLGLIVPGQLLTEALARRLGNRPGPPARPEQGHSRPRRAGREAPVVHLVLGGLSARAQHHEVDVDVGGPGHGPGHRVGDVLVGQRLGHARVHGGRLVRVAAEAVERELVGAHHARRDLDDPDRLAAQLQAQGGGERVCRRAWRRRNRRRPRRPRIRPWSPSPRSCRPRWRRAWAAGPGSRAACRGR